MAMVIYGERNNLRKKLRYKAKTLISRTNDADLADWLSHVGMSLTPPPN
jgi:hypothetical protein